jgi:hypothetical protein
VKALFIASIGVLEIREQLNPEAGAGEVLVRVRAAGMNNADLGQRMLKPRLKLTARSCPSRIGECHDQKRANPGFTHRLATALRPGIVDRLRTEQHRHRSDAGEGVVTAD